MYHLVYFNAFLFEFRGATMLIMNNFMISLLRQLHLGRDRNAKMCTLILWSCEALFMRQFCVPLNYSHVTMNFKLCSLNSDVSHKFYIFWWTFLFIFVYPISFRVLFRLVFIFVSCTRNISSTFRFVWFHFVYTITTRNILWTCRFVSCLHEIFRFVFILEYNYMN